MTKVLIIGGGTAGWLAAAIIAARHQQASSQEFQLTLVESSDIPTIGVGEGTWPTLKNTLQDIGLSEKTFFAQCHAGFKQGGRFVGWVHGQDDFYYHPFTLPLGYGRLDLAPYLPEVKHYAREVNFQHHVCEAGLAPRTLAEAEFQGALNYAYHLDAGAFADLLRVHCKEKLGVEHQVDTVKEVSLADDGSLASVTLAKQGPVTADLFIDCTGFASLLLGEALQVPFVSQADVLFNDRALAMQVPYQQANDQMASHTIATAQNSGWIWDIGLSHRRGVGHVYASSHLSDEEALANLQSYLGPAGEGLEARQIRFPCGHRAEFWKQNCVAVGLSAGFVEPLEATAIMLIEVSARYIAENLPPTPAVMPVIAKRFNAQMHYRWRRIIDFLKLHYMLSQRQEPYWQRHREPETIPDSLQEDLALWQCRGPLKEDFDNLAELFPAASYQYVIYGMEFSPDFSLQGYSYSRQAEARQLMANNQQLTAQLLQSLPPHRQYIQKWLAKER